MFIDCHLHTARRQGLPHVAPDLNYASPDELIAMMDRTGVDRGILLPLVSPECRNQPVTSEDVLEVCEAYPDRFYPFCNVDPRAGGNSPESDFSPLLSYFKERGCLGVGEVTANLEFGDPLVQNLLHHCEACGLPVILHVGPANHDCYGLIDALGLPGLEASLAAFPGLTFIGHSQPFWAEISGDVTVAKRNGYPPGPVVPGGDNSRLMARYPNLYCGWDAGSGYNALTRDPEFGWSFMETYSERILFGTDICAPSNVHLHAEYLRRSHDEGHISDAAFENISWRTANRLFGLGL